MCVAICSLGAEVPTLSELSLGCMNNPDGFGFAVLVNVEGAPTIVCGHGMQSASVISSYLDEVAKWVACGAEVVASVFHARITTHGATSLDNCHPFTVAGERSVLVHNGMLPIDLVKGDARSDSNVLASDVLPLMGGAVALSNPVVGDMFEAWVEANGSKVVVLSAEPDASPVQIFGERLGYWDDERSIWFSNSSCKPRLGLVGSPAATLEDVPCANPECFALVSVYDDECLECETCQTCGMPSLGCECYRSFGDTCGQCGTAGDCVCFGSERLSPQDWLDYCDTKGWEWA